MKIISFDSEECAGTNIMQIASPFLFLCVYNISLENYLGWMGIQGRVANLFYRQPKQSPVRLKLISHQAPTVDNWKALLHYNVYVRSEINCSFFSSKEFLVTVFLNWKIQLGLRGCLIIWWTCYAIGIVGQLTCRLSSPYWL